MTELLTINTLVQRDTIPIKSKKHPDGKTYEISNARDFGPMEYAILQQRGREISPLLSKTRLTAKQKARVAEVLDEMVSMIVRDLEPAVRRELTTQEKQMIVLAWTSAIESGRAEGKARRSRSTGSK